MRDIRIDRWADILVNYSLQAKKGQYALIVSDIEGLPLMEACYEKLLIAGVNVEPVIIPQALSEIQFKYGTDQQLSFVKPGILHACRNCDLYLRIGSDTNSKLLANVKPKKQSLSAIAGQPILEAILNRAAVNKLKWVYTHFPTASAAQEAEMGTREYEEFVFSLGYLNSEDPISEWRKIEKEQQKLIDYFETKKELRFQNEQGTDLIVDISGMKWVNCCGRINFPDGEIYTGPNLNASNGGVNGVVKYSFPTLYKNVEVHDIELEFEKGAVVKAKASKGQNFLQEMIQLDDGAKFVGEIAMGTNENMTKITKNILFDEKFGKTFHLALGKGYPETGNTNKSALHWDIIFDLRNGGKIFADGELVSKDGQFIF